MPHLGTNIFDNTQRRAVPSLPLVPLTTLRSWNRFYMCPFSMTPVPPAPLPLTLDHTETRTIKPTRRHPVWGASCVATLRLPSAQGQIRSCQPFWRGDCWLRIAILYIRYMAIRTAENKIFIAFHVGLQLASLAGELRLLDLDL